MNSLQHTYSKNKEDKHITSYFTSRGITHGKFIDIGAANPTVNSNTRKLYDMGWTGIMAEPAPKPYDTLKNAYQGSHRVILLETAIDRLTGKIKLFEEVNGYEVSTVSVQQQIRLEQENINYKFKETWVNSLNMNDFLNVYGYKTDFLNINTTGTGYELFEMLPETFLKTLSCICIEHCGRQSKIIEKMLPLGFVNLFFNYENLIMAKEI